jgi:hypothetical protein
MWVKSRTFALTNYKKAVPLHFDVERNCLGVLNVVDIIK